MQIPPIEHLPGEIVLLRIVDELTPIVGIAIVVIGLLIGYAIRTRARNRTVAAPTDPQLLRPVEERLGRLEQAVEAIGVEMERVAEGQRFVTKLLADSRDTPRLPANH